MPKYYREDFRRDSGDSGDDNGGMIILLVILLAITGLVVLIVRSLSAIDNFFHGLYTLFFNWSFVLGIFVGLVIAIFASSFGQEAADRILRRV